MLGNVVVAFAADIYTVIIFDYREDKNCCGATDIDLSANYTTVFRNTVGFLVPNSVVAVLNGLILHRMQKYQAQRSSMMFEKESSNKGQNRSLPIILATMHLHLLHPLLSPEMHVLLLPAVRRRSVQPLELELGPLCRVLVTAQLRLQGLLLLSVWIPVQARLKERFP